MSHPDASPGHELQQLRAELVRSQQQVADMTAAQEEFLRAVSHDLRAPLRHVTSYGTLVREVLHDLPPDVRQGAEVQEALGFLATMHQSARRMGLMIDGLLALARASGAPVQWQAVPLAQAVAQAQATLAAAQAPGPAVEWRIDPGLPTLHADAALLHELLVQLLGNALKFSRGGTRPPCIAVQTADPLPASEPRVAAASAQGDGAPQLVAFTISDNGAGFDNSRATQLFGVFQRLHRESEFEGVGAGLALCRAIAQRHGGAITATGEPGVGCTVRVQWPGV